MRGPKALLTIIIIAAGFLSLATPRTIPQAHAAPINLFGRVLTPGGWGFTSSTVANPGPTITTTPGASLSFNLFSGDSATHQFCVDYEIPADLVCNGNEVPSALFSSPTTAKVFAFTITSIPGNYTYFCTIHQEGMIGTIIVKAPHDVAVSGISSSRNVAFNSITLATPIQVPVTAQNPGNSTETFTVTALVNTTVIGSLVITLAPAATRIVTFNWTSAPSLARGSYQLIGNVSKVTGEAYLANNQIIGPAFFINLRGDVNGDCKVDIVDLATVGSTFGKTAGTTGYNPAADLDNSKVIDIIDLVLVAGTFGHIC